MQRLLIKVIQSKVEGLWGWLYYYYRLRCVALFIVLFITQPLRSSFLMSIFFLFLQMVRRKQKYQRKVLWLKNVCGSVLAKVNGRSSPSLVFIISKIPSQKNVFPIYFPINNLRIISIHFHYF